MLVGLFSTHCKICSLSLWITFLVLYLNAILINIGLGCKTNQPFLVFIYLEMYFWAGPAPPSQTVWTLMPLIGEACGKNETLGNIFFARKFADPPTILSGNHRQIVFYGNPILSKKCCPNIHSKLKTQKKRNVAKKFYNVDDRTTLISLFSVNCRRRRSERHRQALTTEHGDLRHLTSNCATAKRPSFTTFEMWFFGRKSYTLLLHPVVNSHPNKTLQLNFQKTNKKQC